MNTTILDVKSQILSGKGITKQQVMKCQESISDEEELFYVYWIMSRYYLDRGQENAMTYCVLKCYELDEKNHFDVEFKVKDFLEARTDFMEEAMTKTRTRLLPLSILFGVITLILVWMIMSAGEFTGFIIGFICMNIVSIGFQQIGFKKTIEKFKIKQYAAVYSYLDDEDKKFADGH